VRKLFPIALLVLSVAALATAGPAAAAATRTKVEPATTIRSLYFQGSNQYYLEFKAVTKGRGAANVSVNASHERYKDELISLTYTRRGRVFADGGFAAKMPGLGEVDVHFHQTKSQRVDGGNPGGCDKGITTFRHGYFTGPVKFRGRGNFTVASARRTKGQIVERTRQSCKVPVDTGAGGKPVVEYSTEARQAILTASGHSAGATVDLTAIGPRQVAPGTGGSGIPTDLFTASYESRWRGMAVLGEVDLDAGSNTFSAPGPAGTLTEATVAPSGPFTGTGTFHAAPPAAATWTGDLGLNLPGIGVVPLTGPGVTAELCEERGPCVS
jgi:hypothetical protein